MLGLQNRNDPEMWYQVELYGATRLEPYDDPRKQLAAVPPGARIAGSGLFEGSLTPRIGREVLLPRAEASVEVLARFADGAVAATCHPYGKGRAYVVGFFPGLEYSAAIRTDRYDMRRDLQQDAPAACRRMVAAPALLGTSPVVDAADPLVEGVLLTSADGKTRAVTLANWAYGTTAVRQDAAGRQEPVVTHLPLENLEITIRHAGNVTRVTSCMLDRSLPFNNSSDKLTVVLPRLEEGDVLLLR